MASRKPSFVWSRPSSIPSTLTTDCSRILRPLTAPRPEFPEWFMRYPLLRLTRTWPQTPHRLLGTRRWSFEPDQTHATSLEEFPPCPNALPLQYPPPSATPSALVSNQIRDESPEIGRVFP